MKIFGLKNCDKCRLALKTLLSSGVNVSLIDVINIRPCPVGIQEGIYGTPKF